MPGSHRSLFALIALAGSMALGGCAAQTLVDVATAPVRLVGEAVDLATTSQSESDEKRGRAMRQHEERLGQLERAHSRHRRDCERGDGKACRQAEQDRQEIRRLLAAGPDDY